MVDSKSGMMIPHAPHALDGMSPRVALSAAEQRALISRTLIALRSSSEEIIHVFGSIPGAGDPRLRQAESMKRRSGDAWSNGKSTGVKWAVPCGTTGEATDLVI